MERAVALTPGPGRVKADLGYTYAIAGHKDKARAALNESLQSFRPESFPASMIAEVYIGLGDRHNALSGSTARWTRKTSHRFFPAIRCLIRCAKTRAIRRS
jgi:hypothetical protein